MTKQKQQVSVLFMLFSILFCVCLIAANILETKQISVLGISLTGGLIVFPISYIINDCGCEVWGFQKARLLIW
ncbi:MAG: VUT family protein, partial [Prevotella histicola]